MSDFSSSRVDIDYAELNGRVGGFPKKYRNSKMANHDLQAQAVNITSDVEDLSDSYQVENLMEEDELNEFVIKIGDMKRDFRRIHAQLKIAVGEDFENKYPGYEEQLEGSYRKF